MATERDFETEWNAVHAQVRRYCLGQVNNPADVDDIVQKVAVRAWRGFGTFRGDAAFLTWVIAIARREIAREMGRRGEQRRRESSLDTILETAPGQLLNVAAPEEAPPAADARWVAAEVRGAVAAGELSEAEGQVVLARLARPEPSWEEVGVRLGITANAAAVTHCRAIPRLRVYLILHAVERLGGLDAVAEAFDGARHDLDDPLSDDEAEVFERIVLRGERNYRRVGWRLALRAAATKVVQRLPLPD